MKSVTEEADVIIVGGGPAGLSAALVLGRSCFRVLLVDANQPRNAVSAAVHGFLSRDGISPGDLRQIAFDQLSQYPGVRTESGMIVTAEVQPDGKFVVGNEADQFYRCRKLLLATGVADVLPDLPGIHDFYGHSVFHCPVCDGWEQRDQPLAITGCGPSAFDYVTELLTWSREVTLCTDGPPRLEASQVKQLLRLEVKMISKRIDRLSGRGRQLESVVFKDGSKLDCRALFFCSKEKPRSALAVQLGAEVAGDGRVKEADNQQTSIPGLFVAGNASRGVQLAIVAAAEGAKAAHAIAEQLNQENLGLV